jgi:hypothetical protein
MDMMGIALLRILRDPLILSITLEAETSWVLRFRSACARAATATMRRSRALTISGRCAVACSTEELLASTENVVVELWSRTLRQTNAVIHC